MSWYSQIFGLKNITQGIGLDISPYAVGGMDTKKDLSNKYPAKGGFDLFYQITPSLKSSLTVNTDFAETEVDDRQINLTRFDLLFPEKRDFFLDGASLFSFGIQGEKNPIWPMITAVLSSMYQMELENIKERTSVGRQ